MIDTLRQKNTSAGFTIIEILVVVGIIGSLAFAIGNFNADIFKFNRIFTSSLNSAGDAQKILRPMVNEIRAASLSATGAYEIEQAGRTSFVFFTDTDDDGIAERIRYYLDGTTLMRGVVVATVIINGSVTSYTYNQASETSKTLIRNIRNGTPTSLPIFQYFDSSYDGRQMETPGGIPIETIRLVKITVTIDEDLTKLPADFTVSTNVNIRNLKTNL